MHDALEKFVFDSTGAEAIVGTQLIQNLWSNFGALLKLQLKMPGAESCFQSIILKYVQIPKEQIHPKGFATDLSKQRKIASYEVEHHWYRNFNVHNLCDSHSRTAKLINSHKEKGEYWLLLEDLDAQGFLRRIQSPNTEHIHTVLSWLAAFHAKHLGVHQQGLWPTGTYWHLETRPDELTELEDERLKMFAPLIDARLKQTKFQTLVHGDAKIANFCFSEAGTEVAAVDFQYVGRGPGVKDLAYFIGSCLSEKDCEKQEETLLNYYFSQLKHFVSKRHENIDFTQLECQWRFLYHFAWADFHRFLKGWSPDHWKINTYSEKVTQSVLSTIENELLDYAKVAARQAGEAIRQYWRKDFQINSKDCINKSKAAQVVTEVDLLSEKIILSTLQSSIESSQLGFLCEESRDNHSRFKREFFWCIDPLDGTLAFSEGKPGFAVSIALVSKAGEPILAVVYDPVGEKLYHAIKNKGAYQNDQPIFPKSKNSRLEIFSDSSIIDSSDFRDFSKNYSLNFSGGAVINCINVATSKNTLYFKKPRLKPGGCALWDLAAVSLIVRESGGMAINFEKVDLSFNCASTPYFHEKGILIFNKENFFEDTQLVNKLFDTKS